ncbi:MAG: DegV family protein [Actinobacteria bacterium]|nr:DegV family protein [Actinomycetota bacterium]
MPKIAIVTDSTADMPPSYYEENDVTMVPLVVRFGEDLYKDWVEMPPKKFYAMMRAASAPPKTSQPSVQDFIEAYRKHSGCDHIFSIHLSSKLSGTYQSANIASQSIKVPVTVIDSKQASIGTALILGELIKARNEGKGVAEISRIAEDLIRSIRILFCVDTLKYLELGGRIGKASALVGSILNIKPILTLDDGIVVPLKKVKGRKKLYKEIVEIMKKTAAKKIKVGMIHADAPEIIADLENLIRAEGIKYDMLISSEIGSVIGTYVGPGTFGVVFYPEEQEANTRALIDDR